MKQAAAVNPGNPNAHQQLGFMTLYGTSNGFTAAEGFIKKPLNSAAARFSASFTTTTEFSATPAAVRSIFPATACALNRTINKHTFDTTDANIKQVKTNSSRRRAVQTKSGSFKIILNDQSDKDGRKFSFAPLTDNIEESKIVIRLIGK